MPQRSSKYLMTGLVVALMVAIAGPPAQATAERDGRHPGRGNGGNDQSAKTRPPRPAFEVTSSLRPVGVSPPAFADGRPRPLARLADALGNAVDFVADEVVVSLTDAQLPAFLARWRGTLLETVETGATPLRLVRIDASALGDKPVKTLGENLQRIDPGSRGGHSVSSTGGLGALGAAAQETADGVTVGINWLSTSAGIDERLVFEAPASSTEWKQGDYTYGPNPFSWPYMADGSVQDTGVVEAWRMLSISGRLNTQIRAAVIDGGFEQTNRDYPVGVYGSGRANQLGCGNGNACPWHGTAVTQAMAGNADNGWGTAGSGAGAIGDIRLYEIESTFMSSAKMVYRAVDAGAKIINISSSARVPASLSFANTFYEDATQTARERGSLVIASAGNENIDVDAEDCIGWCWEEAWTAPCENEGVICVGGMAWNSRGKEGMSNYGWDSCGHAPCDVDIFGPWTVFTGTDPDNNSASLPRVVGGTSVASPFVAGVAALIWAVDPNLTDDDVQAILLTTAHSSPDHFVGRTVDAAAAVHAAFGNVPPGVTITAPADSASVGYGGVNAMAFRATARDWEDGAACCTTTWSSNVDGRMGEGALDYVFTTPGIRWVTATTVDSAGARDTQTITVTARNQAPTVTVGRPVDNQMLVRNVSYRFDAEVFDFNELGLDCGSVVWESTGDAGFPTTGCRPDVSFATTGWRIIKASVTDERGAVGSVMVSVNVGDQLPGSPPEVVITSPSDQDTISFYGQTTAYGQAALEPGEDSPVEYLWTVTQSGVEKEIGYDYWIDWTQADTLFQGTFTLTLYARDDDGRSHDSITLHSYPPPK